MTEQPVRACLGIAGSDSAVRVGEAVAAASLRLQTVSETPRLDSELLMAHSLGRRRETMLLQDMQAPSPSSFEALVERRLAFEPIAYIIGRRSFWTIEIEVGPGVLIPRPDSETLVEAAIAGLPDRPPARILDLGTGPGTLLLSALDHWKNSTGLGVDCSERALSYARLNADRLGLGDRSEWLRGDWARGINERFDLVLCNPPYVEQGAELKPDVGEWEPAQALFGGPDGLDAYRILAPQLANSLAPGGLCCLEVGAGQAEKVSNLLLEQGLCVSSRNDLAGIARCLIATSAGDAP